jgi:hypothetical protein
MSATKKFVWIVSLISMLALYACSSPSDATPTTEPNAIYTQAAETVMAQMTKAAALVPTETEAPPPTDTPEPSPTTPVFPTLPGPDVNPAAPTNAPAIPTLPTGPLEPAAGPTNTSAAQYFGDRALYQYNVPADGTTFAPCTRFSAAFGWKNVGSTTWTTKYTFRFISGDQLSGTTKVPFPKEVKPGQKIELDIGFIAPCTPGKYTTHWAIYNGSGVMVREEIYMSIKSAN